MRVISEKSIEVKVQFTVDEVDLLKRGGDVTIHEVKVFHDATSIKFKGVECHG